MSAFFVYTLDALNIDYIYIKRIMSSQTSKILLALTVGAVAGGAAALFLSSEKGEETREKLSEAGEKLKQELDQKIQEISDFANKHSIEDISENFNKTKSTIIEEYEALKTKIDELENEIKSKADQFKEHIS